MFLLQRGAGEGDESFTPQLWLAVWESTARFVYFAIAMRKTLLRSQNHTAAMIGAP